MKKFTPQPMVGWYDAKQLISTGIKTVVSSIFGSYADKRETLAALYPEKHYHYDKETEVWLDYMADTGDGFNSTFSMASLLARPNLDVQNHDGNGNTILPRAKVVVLGGDEVYPTSTQEEYENRFIGPFSSAFPNDEDHDPNNNPHMYAVPGNHDWYDGLTNFIKIFCQQSKIGNWQTKQNRSYFAIQLRPNLWMWAIDIQLESAVDLPQLEYFRKLASQEMKPGDKLILATAEPSWVYSAKPTDRSYQNLAFFEKNFIEKYELNLVLTLAGDLHHYARYIVDNNGNESNPKYKITSGGGGAFLHPTHNLPAEVSGLTEGSIRLDKTFPSKAESKKLLSLNFLFPFLNKKFGSFMGLLYMLTTWMVCLPIRNNSPSFDDFITDLPLGDFPDFFMAFLEAMTVSPFAFILIMTMIGGLYAFCDTKSKPHPLLPFIGLLHGLLHVALNLSSIWIFTHINIWHLGLDPEHLGSYFLLLGEIFIIGGFFGCVLMGLYLFLTNLIFGVHDNEAFSSLQCEGYKNFLRMHITDDELIIYPIGLRKTAKWKQSNENYFTTDDKLEPFMIEKPLVIKL